MKNHQHHFGKMFFHIFPELCEGIGSGEIFTFCVAFQQQLDRLVCGPSASGAGKGRATAASAPLQLLYINSVMHVWENRKTRVAFEHVLMRQCFSLALDSEADTKQVQSVLLSGAAPIVNTRVGQVRGWTD